MKKKSLLLLFLISCFLLLSGVPAAGASVAETYFLYEKEFDLAESNNLTEDFNFKALRRVDPVKGTSDATETATLTLVGNEGIYDNEYSSVQFNAPVGVAFSIPANVFVREGFLFVGWNTSADGKGDSYSDKGTIIIDGPFTLYAQWEEKPDNIAIITFKPNGESWISMGIQQVNKGQETQLNANQFFNKDAEFFTGWNTEPDGTGTSYSDQALVTISSDLTLYAQWGSVQTFSDTDSPAAYIRNQMKNRVSTICFRYIGTWDMDTVWADAIDHTGIADEGDYLHWQVESATCKFRSVTVNGTRYYDMTVIIGPYYSTNTQEESVAEAIANFLSSLGLTGKTDFEKFDAIYRYIVQNVEYHDDNTHYCHTAHAAMVAQNAVCQGYANLLYRMLLSVGIDNRIITGWGYGGSGDAPVRTGDEDTDIANGWERHAWNIVKLGDFYYNVDATWDSTGVRLIKENDVVIRVEYPYNYFLKSESSFPKHERDAEYMTDSFVTRYPISPSDYPIAEPTFATKSLVLTGQIGVNFFVDMTSLTAAERSNSYMTFTTPYTGKITTEDGFDNTHVGSSGSNLFGFTCFVNSIQMADTITATFHYHHEGETQDGKEVWRTISLDYSVKDYIDYIMLHKEWFSDKTVDLVKALQNYGYHAQQYFADLYSWTIGTGHAAMPAASTTSYNYDSVKSAVAKYEISRPVAGKIESIQFSVDASSETLIYLYVTMKDETVPTAALIGENEEKTALDPILSGGNVYKYQIASLKASELGKSITVELSGGGTTKVSVSALSYVYAVLNSTAEGIKDLDRNFVSALYYYYDAIQNYMTASN